MDKHDKEFEAYLRQFRLRQPGPPPEMASVSPRGSMRWLIAAAVVVLTVGVSAVLVRNSGGGDGPKATVEAAGSPSLYRAGEVIESGTAIRANSAVGLVLALEDGSRVEMREQSELKLESADDGIRVRLNDGSIVVTAAKQASGRRLYVQTRDAVVSVVGTVFLVTAEQSGTSVGVVEGEVHVQQGPELKKLLPGEQVATSPSMQLKPVADQISWSRSAVEYVAMLQQPATPVAPTPVDPVASTRGEVPSEVAHRELSQTGETQSAKLPFKVQANYVRVTTDEVRTLITIQLMNRDLAFQDVGGAKRAEAYIEADIYRIDNRRLPGFSEDVLMEFPTSTLLANLNEPTIFQVIRYLTPGKYKVHITIKDMNSQNVGVMDYVLNVPRISDQTLQASSMILAYSISDLPTRGAGVDPFALGDKTVKPNVTGAFQRDRPLNVWQEIYGLVVDETTRKPSATFELLISQNKQEIRKTISTSAEWLSAVQTMVYTNSIPLSGFAPGAYDVQLKVTDNVAKASFVSTGKFTVTAPSVQTAPTQITSGKQIFDRECTSCHNADVALRPLSNGQPVSVSSQSASVQAELAQLFMRGMTPSHPEVRVVQAKLTASLKMEAEMKNNYSNIVLSHMSRLGGTVSPVALPTLVEYAFGEAVKKAETQGTSVPQDRPAPPPAIPVLPNDAPKEDPDVAGARILNSACTGCHDLGPITSRTGDRKTWEGIVSGMVGYGASVKDSEIPVLVDYLFKRYGPPRPRP